MRRYTGTVTQGMSGWSINSNQELCSIDGTWLDSLPVSVGDNIRIYSPGAGRDAAYTIARTHDDGGSERVRMGAAARDKLFFDATTPSSFECTFVPSIPNVESKSQTDAENREELWEEAVIHPSHEFVVTGPHAGSIEYNTERQARACHSHLTNSSLWVCHAEDDAAYPDGYNRWHITSGDINARSFPRLNQINQYEYRSAVSFHGYSGDEVLVGGRAPAAIRDEVVAELDQLDDTVVRRADDETYDGNDPENFVNWLTSSGDHGIQLEFPRPMRDTFPVESGRRVAKAILRAF